MICWQFVNNLKMSSKLALPNLATITEGLEQDNFLYENPFVSPVLAGDEADDESDLHRKSSFRVFTRTISWSLFSRWRPLFCCQKWEAEDLICGENFMHRVVNVRWHPRHHIVVVMVSWMMNFIDDYDDIFDIQQTIGRFQNTFAWNKQYWVASL